MSSTATKQAAPKLVAYTLFESPRQTPAKITTLDKLAQHISAKPGVEVKAATSGEARTDQERQAQKLIVGLVS